MSDFVKVAAMFLFKKFSPFFIWALINFVRDECTGHWMAIKTKKNPPIKKLGGRQYSAHTGRVWSHGCLNSDWTFEHLNNKHWTLNIIQTWNGQWKTLSIEGSQIWHKNENIEAYMQAGRAWSRGCLNGDWNSTRSWMSNGLGLDNNSTSIKQYQHWYCNTGTSFIGSLTYHIPLSVPVGGTN